MSDTAPTTGSFRSEADARTLRLFVAVPLPDALRSLLQTLARKLQDDFPFHKWTHPDDLHVTVQFLGETAAGKIEGLQASLRDVAAAHAGFPLSLAGLGVFGQPSRPSILWAGLQGDKSSLEALHRSVVKAMAQHGFEPEDRPFRPHVTLARRYAGSRPFSRAALAPFENALNGSDWTSDRLVLYRSHLGRSPMYEAIAEFVYPN